MQRSPVIFWLLLAATICVDAVATIEVYWAELNEEPAAALFLALAFAQLGILCVWVVFVPKGIRFSWLAPLMLGIAVASVVALSASGPPASERWEGFLAFIVLTWTHVAIVLPILWLLKPTRVGVAYANLGAKARWQFSMMHLLTVMTCLSILCVLLRQSEWAARDIVVLVTLPIANVSLLLFVIVAVQSGRHWLLRLAISLAGALVISAVCEWSNAEIADGMNFFAFNLIQAIVIWPWLEQMRPTPAAELAIAADEPLPG